jgi:hypothetical protein
MVIRAIFPSPDVYYSTCSGLYFGKEMKVLGALSRIGSFLEADFTTFITCL